MSQTPEGFPSLHSRRGSLPSRLVRVAVISDPHPGSGSQFALCRPAGGTQPIHHCVLARASSCPSPPGGDWPLTVTGTLDFTTVSSTPMPRTPILLSNADTVSPAWKQQKLRCCDNSPPHPPPLVSHTGNKPCPDPKPGDTPKLYSRSWGRILAGTKLPAVWAVCLWTHEQLHLSAPPCPYCGVGALQIQLEDCGGGSTRPRSRGK